MRGSNVAVSDRSSDLEMHPRLSSHARRNLSCISKMSLSNNSLGEGKSGTERERGNLALNRQGASKRISNGYTLCFEESSNHAGFFEDRVPRSQNNL